MKHPEANAILERLVASSDVLVQNLGPGAIDRLGFAPARLRRDYPALVITSISGYGAGGPYETRKAFDLLLQGETGVIATTGNGDDLAKVGISVGDIGAAVYGTIGTLAALYERRATGEGRIVETSLFDALSEWMGYPAYYTLYGGEPPARAGCATPRSFPTVPTGAPTAPYSSPCRPKCGGKRSAKSSAGTLNGRPTSGSRHRRCGVSIAWRWSHDRGELSAVPREDVVRRLEAADIPFGSVNEGGIRHAPATRRPRPLARRRFTGGSAGGDRSAIRSGRDVAAHGSRAGCR